MILGTGVSKRKIDVALWLENSPKGTRPSIHRIIKTPEKDIETSRKNIKDHINQNPDLKEEKELLETIPGIEEKNCYLLLG